MSRAKYKYLLLLCKIFKCMTIIWLIFASNVIIRFVMLKEITTAASVAAKTYTNTTALLEAPCTPEEGQKLKYLFILLREGITIERKILTETKQDVILKCPFNQSTYQWYRNGQPLNIRNGTVTIKAFAIDQPSVMYACLENSWHTVKSNEPSTSVKWANVTLIGCSSDDKHKLSAFGEGKELNNFKVLNSHRAVLLNENVDFHCDTLKGDDSDEVDANGASKIIWLKHYAPLNWSENSLFNFTNNLNVWRLPTNRIEPRLLRLGSVQPEDEGWYTCVVTSTIKHSLITDIFSVYLIILSDTQLMNTTDINVWNLRKEPHLEVDSNKRLHNESSSEVNVMIGENKDKKLLKKLENTEMELRENNNTTTITPTNNNHNNNNNKLIGSKENAGVSGGPQFKNIKKLEDNIHKPSGSSVQLMCPATGNPTPNITWTRNNTEIQRTMGRVSYKKWSIQMDDATTEDSGIYKCTICNIHGCIEHLTKVTIRDRLRSPPIISDKFPQNQTVLVNNSTYLECRVVSDLEPSIKWFKYNSIRNVTIKELEQTALKTVNKVLSDQNFLLDSVVTLNPDPDRPNILNFTNVTHNDEGWYTCVASNTLGHSLASAYMRVVDKLTIRDHNPLRGHPVWITAVAVVVVLLFLLGTVFIIYVLRKLKHEKLLKQRIETVHQWTKKVIIYRPPNAEGNGCSDLQMPVIKIEKQRTTFTTSSSSDPMQGFNEYEFPLDSNWEIPRNQLALGSVLGEGAFGRVVMAEATNLTGQQKRLDSTTTIMSASTTTTTLNNTTIVAVKMVKEEHTDADMTSLVHEMEVMKMIGKHINIINLLGCCSQSGPLWVIVEFAPHGNLKDFLKKNRHWAQNWDHFNRNGDYFKKENDDNDVYEDDEEENNVIQLTEKHLISFAFQIARGMEYLASRRCIHRDLAARNVLVSNDFVMKIADFGLARDVQDTDYYRKKTNGRLPIKWMAPESLQDKFYDSQSDVWSYGVLLWEIMTFGQQPYPYIMSAEELYSYLIAGQRMEKPAHCSLNIYMLMRQCWHFDSNARPTFTEIVENLDKILQSANTMTNEEYLDLSIPILETPPSSSDDDESQSDLTNEMTPLRYQYTYKLN